MPNIIPFLLWSKSAVSTWLPRLFGAADLFGPAAEQATACLVIGETFGSLQRTLCLIFFLGALFGWGAACCCCSVISARRHEVRQEGEHPVAARRGVAGSRAVEALHRRRVRAGNRYTSDGEPSDGKPGLVRTHGRSRRLPSLDVLPAAVRDSSDRQLGPAAE